MFQSTHPRSPHAPHQHLQSPPILTLTTTALAQAPSTTPLAPTARSINPWLAQVTSGTYTIPNFKFGTGETLPALNLHYLTLGTPHKNSAGHTDNAVLLLHGTGGNASSLLNPAFSNVLFGPGQPLDITRFLLILPDDIGHG